VRARRPLEVSSTRTPRTSLASSARRGHSAQAPLSEATIAEAIRADDRAYALDYGTRDAEGELQAIEARASQARRPSSAHRAARRGGPRPPSLARCPRDAPGARNPV
jgi:hypothetical protein